MGGEGEIDMIIVALMYDGLCMKYYWESGRYPGLDSGIPTSYKTHVEH